MYDNLVNQIKHKNLNVHGIEVFQNGKITFKQCFSPDVRYPVYSATKSFVSTAVGIACDEGKFSADVPIYEFLDRKYLCCVPASQLDNFKKLTIERLMTMSVAGYPFRPSGSDWTEYALSLPVDYSRPPVFSYSNIPAYLVGTACENAIGEHLFSYLNKRLFEPLGITNPVYKDSPEGHFYGASGMELTVHELSLLGQLYLQNGVFDGNRILSEQWIKKAVSPHIANHEGGYGYFMWITDDGFRISGKWGQKCLIYPQKNLMITYLSDLPERAEEMLEIAEHTAECISV